MKMEVRLNIMKKTLVILSLEPIETRYTKQWFTYLPKYFSEKLENFNIIQIDGDPTEDIETTSGAFLNFVKTNKWKSDQSSKFFNLVSSGDIPDDAVIIITDFWNPVVNMIKYTKELMGKNWHIVGFAHAGMYDPQDFLGRLIKDREWGCSAELSMAYACDKVLFATDFHLELFRKSYYIPNEKVIRSGLPFRFIRDEIKPGTKENIVLFPHRLAQEKRHDLFIGVKDRLPEYTFITCQESKLTKTEYHDLLAKAKILFSANLQETLGISTCGESLAAKVLPLAPDGLSYKEILPNSCKYDMNYLFKDFDVAADYLAEKVQYSLENYDILVNSIDSDFILDKYFDSQILIDYIMEL